MNMRFFKNIKLNIFLILSFVIPFAVYMVTLAPSVTFLTAVNFSPQPLHSVQRILPATRSF